MNPIARPTSDVTESIASFHAESCKHYAVCRLRSNSFKPASRDPGRPDRIRKEAELVLDFCCARSEMTNRTVGYLTHRESENGYAVKSLAGFQFRCREVGMMGRVREMLSLQAKSSPLLVHHSTFSLESAIEEVSGIELYTGLIGEHTQD